ncbi:DoxX family protein [Luteibacter yeojuensis]|uniref:DoxX family protein n=1 Tax=Luteibacter yeojuensis TaxID=345309 RepID=A0A7X5QVK5_9GAMM|nr:DoxX family protein [Luteibacter yeojuensis]NID16122.1 DoxX family protein [Luteibacter yeojuensis]
MTAPPAGRRLASLLFERPSRFSHWAPLAIRLVVGGGFMQHGFAKLLRGPDMFAGILAAIGVPAPELMSWLTVAIEILGGLALVIGAFVTLAAIPMIVVLLVATFTVHLPYGFSSIKLMSVQNGVAHFGQPGYECDLLYLAGIVALMLSGAGPWSVDTLIARRMHRAT